MMLGLVLLYVGVVLFFNVVWLLGKISGWEVVVINFLVGVLSVCVVFYLIFFVVVGQGLLKVGVLILLFVFIYLWVVVNQFFEVDGKGFGWFCLFVSFIVCIVVIELFVGVSGLFGLWNVVNWIVWVLFWFCFFLLLGLFCSIQKLVVYLILVSVIFIVWLFGLLLFGQVFKVQQEVGKGWWFVVILFFLNFQLSGQLIIMMVLLQLLLVLFLELIRVKFSLLVRIICVEIRFEGWLLMLIWICILLLLLELSIWVLMMVLLVFCLLKVVVVLLLISMFIVWVLDELVKVVMLNWVLVGRVNIFCVVMVYFY